ncbi:hypothetical protein FB45DRAFT_891168 [Roridomyces roridus]|uniref:F-box domain-containing protein n=1 Tax=Roridomyces roridus TaxID=1738132 RepID=A0AAD7CE03_9AGAR|nr:hypothetical protein FB45DRAFT_891168 [Roridomyces roridus]
MLRLFNPRRIYDLVFPFTCHCATDAPTQIFRRLPDLPLEIWLEIFQWSTYVYGSTTFEPLDPFIVKHSPRDVMGTNSPILSLHTKCALVRVCHAWRRIAIQILYQHIVIRSPSRATLILQALRDSHSDKANYGYWTRSITLYTHARGVKDIRFLQNVFRILQYCPRLRTFSATWCFVAPKEFLDAVATVCGPNLQGLCWDERRYLSVAKTHASLDFLSSFKSLRVLDLRNFVGDGCLTPTDAAATLPCLDHLILSNHTPNISVAVALHLPALRTLTLQSVVHHPIGTDLITKLLATHGARLTTVHLPCPNSGLDTFEPTQPRPASQHIPPALFLQVGVCPNLEVFTFSANSPPITLHPPGPTHTALRRIALYSVRAEALYPLKRNDTQTHLRLFTRAVFPALETVRTAGFIVDADGDILVKDVFIWWSERFEKDGVDFQDGEGVVWTYGEDSE